MKIVLMVKKSFRRMETGFPTAKRIRYIQERVAEIMTIFIIAPGTFALTYVSISREASIWTIFILGVMILLSWSRMNRKEKELKNVVRNPVLTQEVLFKIVIYTLLFSLIVGTVLFLIGLVFLAVVEGSDTSPLPMELTRWIIILPTIIVGIGVKGFHLKNGSPQPPFRDLKTMEKLLQDSSSETISNLVRQNPKPLFSSFIIVKLRKVNLPFKWKVEGETLIKQVSMDQYVEEILKINPSFPRKYQDELREKLAQPIILNVTDIVQKKFEPEINDGDYLWRIPIEDFVRSVQFAVRVYQHLLK